MTITMVPSCANLHTACSPLVHKRISMHASCGRLPRPGIAGYKSCVSTGVSATDASKVVRWSPAVVSQHVHKVERRETGKEVLHVEQKCKEGGRKRIATLLYARDAPQQDA